ncbi:MAG: phosphohydrolase [Gammaproteobacteria bacterium]|uniref:Phosphohydrolase n=1 Tax=viral metagenome TaxID=1070528 RepID=A0A6M3J7K8_9ZZZZ|nr:phosphohydrolase [Gammaproteobacteria bacterium]MBU1492255.1 phosphohydrolase [Gammaproteobacteria bacterium]MBU2066826.1 phosphohydrolase [Gammaproteobacteria bacterium]MBU2137358.1 phosphohydrolase [Gammaproteobacteria bacterium]MBU2215081.1 phosphohydrolase [Gammaproteobacteria bacterium]
MTWILTNSARAFDLLNPRAEDVTTTDIAHALSLVCRFNGHCAHHYSVAQHSLLVAYIIEKEGGTPEEQLAGLLHDGTEAYISDLTRPLKLLLIEAARQREIAWLEIVAHYSSTASNVISIGAAATRILSTSEREGLSLLLDVYQQIDERIWLAIAEHFHLAAVLPACVKHADMIALATEKRDLLPQHPAVWECLEGYAPLPQRIEKCPHEIIRQQFHDRLLGLLATTNRRRAA